MMSRRAWLGLAALPRPVAAQGGLEALFAPRARLWPRWSGHDEAATHSVDHAPWTGFLRRYRRPGADGIARVDYAGVTPADRQALEAWLSGLAATRVTALRRDEQFCFWVNLYNGLTMRTVLHAPGVASIRDINLSGGIFLRGPWDAQVVTVEGEALTLNDIEHRILRPIWREPRVHYVVNCASLGCPDLPEEALTPARREAMLAAAARAYVAHPRGVTVRPDGLLLSAIYNWFAADFEPDGGVVPHLLRHAGPAQAAAIRTAPGIAGYAYDWALNRAAG
ncbi:DUF547 domain-containing protein [Paracraurococcus ruber]|uniref:DUF547 domain-containing protein n=2 Tax=Paracraurococcus ruber TaxID=77675 RepID=A0ABS1D7H0_9PROT|nr:DUF547 domain-containing protein [Paracraurococcus ruber]MBK1662391.1 hypothetical protein [Paracraurococcus ruber]TDG11680.1 DUF547 domain-containing protein [Paracraurococcus ruber]